MPDEIAPGLPERPAVVDQSRSVYRLEQMIERWWQDHFPGSAVARDTQAWNVAHAAKETLKRLLQGSM